jgi:hypothetical protein
MHFVCVCQTAAAATAAAAAAAGPLSTFGFDQLSLHARVHPAIEPIPQPVAASSPLLCHLPDLPVIAGGDAATSVTTATTAAEFQSATPTAVDLSGAGSVAVPSHNATVPLVPTFANHESILPSEPRGYDGNMQVNACTAYFVWIIYLLTAF